MDKNHLPIKVDATFKGNLADVTKLGGKIIDSISRACGIIYHPIDTVLNAKADATAKLIEVRGDLDVEGLLNRVGERFLSQQLKQQRNVDQIVTKAIADANSGPVSDKDCDADWINEFVDCSKNVSDDQMQEVLSKILSGEVAQPGRFSRRTLNFVKTLSKLELQTFKRLCGFAWTYNELMLVPHDEHGFGFHYAEEPSFDEIQSCQSIGLLHTAAQYTMPAGSALKFADNTYIVSGDHQLIVSAYPLTTTANELAAAIKYMPLASSPWCWLSRWHSSLEQVSPPTPERPKVKTEELAIADDDILNELIKKVIARLKFWMPSEVESDSLHPDQYMSMYRFTKMKEAAKDYMDVRAEILRRRPDMLEELSAVEFGEANGDC